MTTSDLPGYPMQRAPGCPFDPSPELRRWQVEVLAPGFLKALAHHRAGTVKAAPQPVTQSETSESPYKE